MEEQLVVFQLADEVYGVNILQVERIRIIEEDEVTIVPGAASYVDGVINLRGAIIPIIDLRQRFHLPRFEEREEIDVVIVDLDEYQLGMIVDKVIGVRKVPADFIEPPSPLVAGIEAAYIHGIAKQGKQNIILLDLMQIFTIADKGQT